MEMGQAWVLFWGVGWPWGLVSIGAPTSACARVIRELVTRRLLAPPELLIESVWVGGVVPENLYFLQAPGCCWCFGLGSALWECDLRMLQP